jgi:hypothetical protein
MKVIKKNVTIGKLNAENARTVFRLCGEIPTEMLVNKDLVPPVAFLEEILPHVNHSRHRRRFDHQ